VDEFELMEGAKRKGRQSNRYL